MLSTAYEVQLRAREAEARMAPMYVAAMTCLHEVAERAHVRIAFTLFHSFYSSRVAEIIGQPDDAEPTHLPSTEKPD